MSSRISWLLLLLSCSHSSHALGKHVYKIIHLASSGRLRLGRTCCLMNERILSACLIKDLMAVNFEIILSLHQHWSYHLSHRSVEKLFWKANYILRDTLSNKKLSTFICEIIAVMLQDIVSLSSKSRTHISQKF